MIKHLSKMAGVFRKMTWPLNRAREGVQATDGCWSVAFRSLSSDEHLHTNAEPTRHHTVLAPVANEPYVVQSQARIPGRVWLKQKQDPAAGDPNQSQWA